MGTVSKNQSSDIWLSDDLSREVYGMFGIPVDAVNRRQAANITLAAAQEHLPFLISTPNVNFMAICQVDPEFRDTLLQSDLCLVDGMPIVWLAKFLSIPLLERVSGSDLFEILKNRTNAPRPISVFLFGGGEGIAEQLGEILNSQSLGMHCVGSINPGHGTVHELSAEHFIKSINESEAEFLAIFLSAKKAQTWLLNNHNRINVPVRAQFGATINYQVGTIHRAPVFIQRAGFEWLWRIKEEPYLWRRYLLDGLSLMRMTLSFALPIRMLQTYSRVFRWDKNGEFRIEVDRAHNAVVLRLIGHATKENVTFSEECFRKALVGNQDIVIDLFQMGSIDARFFGLLLMVKKHLRKTGRNLIFERASRRAKFFFRIYGFEYLLKIIRLDGP